MRFWGLIQRRLLTLFPSYRPERHYMRGRGPKWRERHGRRENEALNAVEGGLIRESLFTGG